MHAIWWEVGVVGMGPPQSTPTRMSKSIRATWGPSRDLFSIRNMDTTLHFEMDFGPAEAWDDVFVRACARVFVFTRSVGWSVGRLVGVDGPNPQHHQHTSSDLVAVDSCSGLV